jgi:pimeloyl-ACP methyl ester carboxylesterase
MCLDKFILFGHSLGGYICAVFASILKEFKNYTAVNNIVLGPHVSRDIY